MTTVESRVGALEGRADEQAAAILALRTDIQDVRTELRDGLAAVRTEIAAVNARIDRLFVAMLTIGVGLGSAQVGVLVAIILRT